MKSKYEMILSGVGGQGLILCGSIMGEAATVYENMNASLTSSYGVESRGTFTKSDVIISKEEIHFPEVLHEDIVLALAPVAYNKYVSILDEAAVLIYDSDLVTELQDCKGKQFGYPFTGMARELGSEKAANIIAIGTIVKKTGVLKEASVIQVFKDRFSGKEKIQSLNIEAFKKGLEIG